MRIMILLVIAIAFGGTIARAEPVKLRVSIQLPITSHLGQNVARFKRLVEERTEGAISLEIFDNSKLYSDDQIVDAVASGAIEMGIATSKQFAKYAPALEILQVPFLFNSDRLVRAATDPDEEFRRTLDGAIVAGTRVAVLWWQPYGSSVMFSKGLDTRHPQDITGKRVRVPSESDQPFVKACGGEARVISASKQTEALGSGQVDVVMTGITGVTGRKLWTVSDTVTRTEHAPIEFVVFMNSQSWSSLSEPHRTVFATTAREVERELRDQYGSIERDAYAFAKDKGMKIVDLSSDEVSEWRLCSLGLLEAYMAGTGEIGHRLMSAYGRLRAKSDATPTLRN